MNCEGAGKKYWSSCHVFATTGKVYVRGMVGSVVVGSRVYRILVPMLAAYILSSYVRPFADRVAMVNTGQYSRPQPDVSNLRCRKC